MGETRRESEQHQDSKPLVSLALLVAASLLVGFSMRRWLALLVAWIGPLLMMRYACDHKFGCGYLLVVAACILAMLIGFDLVRVGAPAGGMTEPA